MSEQTTEPSSSPLTPCEMLLGSLIESGEIHLVVKNEGVTAELRGRGELRASPQWLTIEVAGGPDHVHLRRGALARAEFSAEPGKNRSVRFLDGGGRVLLACLLPGTREGAPAYAPDRVRALERLEAAHRREAPGGGAS